tara:strand:- start:40 stop:804 length:765 start_codon:yes stop_codon:yes gene_type:complete
MQGRLTTPDTNHMQEFPIKNWRQEFDILKNIDLRGVEWIVTKKHFLDNPLVLNPKMIQNFPISSVCLDVLVDKNISQRHFLEKTLGVFCYLIGDTSINKITIPLLEESSLEDDEKRKDFCQEIVKIADKYQGINFSFEAELSIKKLNEIISLRDNFSVTYDTGNITSYGIEHSEYINFFKEKINNVHIKDRTYDARTVAPLTGDTKFSNIFQSLKDINYDGSFVLQTARGTPGQETKTVIEHKKIFEEIYEKYF